MICRKLSRDSIVLKRAHNRVTLSPENHSRTHLSPLRTSIRKKKKNLSTQVIPHPNSPRKLNKLATFSTLYLQPNLNPNSPKTPCHNNLSILNYSNNSLKDRIPPHLTTLLLSLMKLWIAWMFNRIPKTTIPTLNRTNFPSTNSKCSISLPLDNICNTKWFPERILSWPLLRWCNNKCKWGRWAEIPLLQTWW